MKLAQYILQRFVTYLAVLFIGITITFFLPRLMPGDPINNYISQVQSRAGQTLSPEVARLVNRVARGDNARVVTWVEHEARMIDMAPDAEPRPWAKVHNGNLQNNVRQRVLLVLWHRHKVVHMQVWAHRRFACQAQLFQLFVGSLCHFPGSVCGRTRGCGSASSGLRGSIREPGRAQLNCVVMAMTFVRSPGQF